jgi:PrtD family type I secretion system ABC transporter
VLFFLHPVLFAVAVSGALALFSIAIVTEFLTRKPLGQAANHLGSASQFASEVQASTSTVEAMGMTHGLCERWQSQSQKGLAQQAKASDRAGILTATTKFIRPVLQVAILGVGAFLVLNLEISAGAMIASSIIMGRALAPVEGAIGNWRSFVLARSAYGRISDTLHSPGRVYSSLPLPRPEGHVSVENVIAGPPGSDTPVIKGITFALSAGEALGVVGPSAAGKSTLARLLLGVWPTEKGCVRLDGADVAGWSRAELGPHIGYLSQSIELFDGTIAENIARFDTNAPSEAIIAAAKEAGVHEMILRQPDGYSTRIGRGGLVLSGGQRQRIGLARALYGNPSFIILDEPNSNLDAQGEIALAHAMRNLKKRGATVVVITHRRSILDNVDKVLVLRDGAVEHFGSSEDVMNALSRSARQNYAAQVEQSKDRQSDDASSGVTALASRSG